MQLQIRLQGLLDHLVASGQERGVQAAIYSRGALVADAWAGVADARSGASVTGETLFPVFSTTKGIAATVIHRLAERGIVGYDVPLIELWPEFAAHGKGGITLRHVLNHTAGLPLVPLGADIQSIGDWDFMCELLADATPVSAPGERVEYHAITFGWLLGEVARRATGLPFAELLRHEIAAPLGVDGLFVGTPPEKDPLVAWLEEPDTPPAVPVPEAQAIPYWLVPLGAWMNRADARCACLPASNGVMNARAIARHYAALVPGGVDGVELLPPARVREAMANKGDESAAFGLGYALFPAHGAFGHLGHGGSLGMAHIADGWALGFARNRFGPSNSGEQVLQTLRAWR